MGSVAIPHGRSTQRAPAVKEVHVLWITAGLSCDGDTISVTAAEQPSIEDIVLGAIPGLPKVHLHNPVLAYEVRGVAAACAETADIGGPTNPEHRSPLSDPDRGCPASVLSRRASAAARSVRRSSRLEPDLAHYALGPHR